MKKLTELSIKRPLLILVIFTVLILFGIISYRSLNYNLLPKFDANVVSVVTTYRGASADEIENTVTKQVEDALSSLEGIKKITSSSQEGASVVTVELIAEANVDKAQNDAQRKVDQIALLLPKDVDRSIVNKFSSDNIPVMRMGVSAATNDKDLYDIIDQQIKPQLGSIPGVGQINLIGGNERQIIISANPDKLQSYNMTIAQLAQVVNLASLSTPAGKIETANDQFTLKFDAKFNDIEQLKSMVVFRGKEGGDVRLSDVADVMDGQTEVTNINRINGLPSIGIQVMKQSDANAVEVSKLVQKKIAQIEGQYGKQKLKFNIASDQSTYTLESANAVMFDLALAIIIVSFVMLMFLHSIRSSLFVLVALPASMIPTFIFMYVFGMSLNLMTLMALSLVVGILVDDSIVILENIMRHMEMGKNKRQATIDGRAEIGFTAMAITLVDVVVFLPMAMTSGMIGNILREFALVVVCSTLMSLMVCFTLTPLLASRFARIVHLDKRTAWGRMNLWFENQITNLRDAYTSLLKWCLGKKRYVFILTILLLIGSFTLVGKGFIGFAFISKGDQGEMVVKIEMSPNSSLYQTSMATQTAEQIILRQPEVKNMFTNIGYSSTGVATTNNNNLAEINVKLVDKKERLKSTEQFSNDIFDSLSNITGAKITIGQMDIMGNAAQADIQYVVKGTDRAQVKKVAEDLKKIVAQTPGTQYVEFSTKNPKPQIEISLDRQKMAMYGVNPSDVANAIASSFRGNDNAKFTYKGNEYDIMVQNDASDRSSMDNIKNLSFLNAQGQSFTLSQFASVNEVMGETILQRTDRLTSILVNATSNGRSPGTIGQELSQKFDAYFKKNKEAVAGVTYEPFGNLANTADSFLSLLMALGIGIMLVYLIMVALYENAIYPFVVLFALPLAMIGAFLALALTMNELTIFAMIGLIMLMGLVAKNGILLVDFTNQRKAEGATLVEALIDAGKERFRPILMTTIAMIVGMLPIALATGSGAEVKNGMAWVIIGGLTSSLLLTLIVVPCVYYLVDKMLGRFRRRKRKKATRLVIQRQATQH
ncbi:MAG: efflux RND transporter permease subunit [Sphingobacteriales bacterium]|nr:MAG: efflux RND transporter permease subunit [Sphingobacteriales bacterium]